MLIQVLTIRAAYMYYPSDCKVEYRRRKLERQHIRPDGNKQRHDNKSGFRCTFFQLSESFTQHKQHKKDKKCRSDDTHLAIKLCQTSVSYYVILISESSCSYCSRLRPTDLSAVLLPRVPIQACNISSSRSPYLQYIIPQLLPR